MTDAEIIKALECHNRCYCGGCPYSEIDECPDCLCSDAIDLINHQKAELEELTAEVESLQLDNDSLRMVGNSLKMHYEKANAEIERLQEHNNTLIGRVDNLVYECDCAKQEAIKEFAERLKSKSQYTTDRIGKLQKVVYVEDIDKVKKEITGDQNND